MKLWPFVIVFVGLVLLGTVYLLVREPARGDVTQAGRELPRLPMDRIEAPLPPRFAGPLPTQVEGFQEALEQGPPLSYVRARLLEGDRQMGAKLFSALRQTAASAPSLEELWRTYGAVLGLGDNLFTGDGELPEDMSFRAGLHDQGMPCAWLREWLSQPPEEAPLLTELLWRMLVRCPGAETTALFAREDAPPRWALDHHYLFDRPGFTPALEGAVRRILGQNRQELFTLAKVFIAASPEPVARELREELWRRASDELRAEWKQNAEWKESVRRQEEEHPWKCPPIPHRPEGIDELTVQRCLEEWAASNWAATARFAMSASRSPELRGKTGPLATLRNFPSISAMKDWARERKLLPEAAPALRDDDPEILYLSAYMREAQRAFRINLRTRAFPRRHDDLLVTLAWKVRPALDGVVFEQLSPKNPPPDWFQGPSSDEYTLRAYMDGQRFSVQAQSAHFHVDIGAVLGLLNQLLEARGSPDRFAVLDTATIGVDVVFGPEAALREADARGLWRLGDGKQVLAQAEAAVVEKLRYILGEIPFPATSQDRP